MVRVGRRANVYLVQYSLLHTLSIRYSLLLLGYKPVQHVTVENCYTLLSIIL